MHALSSIAGNDERFFYSLRFEIENTIFDSDPILKTIDLDLYKNGSGYESSFYYGDTITFSYNTFNNFLGVWEIAIANVINQKFSVFRFVVVRHYANVYILL